jgi:TolB-like protein
VKVTAFALLALAVLPPWRLAALQCPDGAPPPCASARAVAAAPAANSVAVLLFENLARDTSYAYLADGLATEIATSLANVPRLLVQSPGVVRRAQRAGGDDDPRALGRRLGVRYVVEGDFQRGGDRLRVTVRLVSVQAGTQRWSAAYTRPMADLLAVQEEIAREVATNIAGTLLPQERTSLAARATRDPAAWDHFMRGNFELARRNPAGVSRAIEEYEQAVRLDPRFAKAQARIGLGWDLYLDWGWRHPLPRESLLVRALAAADRALALDSLESDGWMAKGYALSFVDPRGSRAALAALDRAVALDPRNVEALHQNASLVGGMGTSYSRAIELERQALLLDPGRAISQFVIGITYAAMGRRDEATRAFDSSLVLELTLYPAYYYGGRLRLLAGDTAGARADGERALRYAPAGDEYYGWALLAMVSAASGDTAAARGFIDRSAAPLRGEATVLPLVAANVAAALVSLHRYDEAMEWLLRARSPGMRVRLDLDLAEFAPLRARADFQQFLLRIQPPADVIRSP